jgi:flagellar secretion chaperone FliS
VPADLRNRFAQTSIETASKPRLVVMLYERLERDLVEAIAAIGRSDVRGAHEKLVHAQDIVQALRGALDLKVWPEGESLQAVYDYMLELLVRANVTKRAEPATTVLDLVKPLSAAWRTAFESGAAGVQTGGRSFDA